MTIPSMTMLRAARMALCAALVLLASGCGALKTVEIQQPLTAKPVAPTAVASTNGSIYQAGSTQSTGYMALFEDRRARTIGDTLVVNINEKLDASKTAASTAARTGNTDYSVSTIKGLPLKTFQGAQVTASSKNDFEGKGDSAANNVFTGTITVTVIEVLPNGNLVVSGEKQIGINQGSEFIRLSGVVNPIYIVFGNQVSSTQIADARLEYRGTGYIDEAQTMGWAARILQSISPF